MPTDFAFRFSTYLTLLLACVCVGYAEAEYLPEATAFTAVVALVMVVAFVCDRRDWVMSLRNANLLGGGIFVAAALWFGFHYRTPDSLMNVLPWPAGGLPYVAALMLLLVPAKLFRPKHVGDWWALQGLGLCMVGVAGAMADDVLFVGLMAAYAVAGVWSLTLFYIRRSAGHVPPPPPFEPVEGLRALVSPQTYLPRWFFVARSRPTVAEPFAGVGRPTPTERLGRSHFVRAVRWVVVGGLLTLPPFLLSPRTEGLRWELFNPRMETGVSASGVDLSRTGELIPNPEPAFTVTVTHPDGTPGVLPDDKRFRVSSHHVYKYPKGQWTSETLGQIFVATAPASVDPVPEARLAAVGSHPIFLEFNLEAKTAGYPLADPTYYDPDRPPPVLYPVRPGLYRHPTVLHNGLIRLNLDRVDGQRVRQYWQSSRAVPDEPSAFRRMDDRTAKNRLPLLHQPSPRIADLAKGLLDRLIREGKLPAGVRDRVNPATLLPGEDDHPAVARAFEQYLATSGEYDYTLTLRRQSRTMDPVEDFLFNTKAGHCERFASALVLLLRSAGIPTQFVLGYRGCQPLDDGHYLVRQDHAHAWAEALLSRPAADGGREWYWQSFDPTAASTDADANLGALDANAKQGSRLFSLFITGFNPDTQRQLIEDVEAFGRQNRRYAVGAVAVAVAALAAVRVVAHRRRAPAAAAAPLADPAPWFTRLVELLARHGHPLARGQTPAEFAAAAAARLAADPKTRSAADVPGRVVAALDSHRYAGRPLTLIDQGEVRDGLDRLEAALA